MLDLARLTELKRLLVEAKDFGDVYGYFLDHFGEEPEFLRLGEPMRDASTFTEIIGHLSAKVTGQKGRVEKLVLMHLPEHKFVHGAFALGSFVASVFYFEDIDRGLAAFGDAASLGPDQFARFSVVSVPIGKSSALN